MNSTFGPVTRPSPNPGFITIEDLARSLVVVPLCFLAVRGGLATGEGADAVSLIRPEVGVAIATGLILGARFLPAVWLGVLIAHVSASRSFLVPALLASGDVLAVIFCLMMMRFRRSEDDTGIRRRLSRYFIFVILAVFDVSVITVAGLCAAGACDWGQFWPHVAAHGLPAASAALTIPPCLMVWRSRQNLLDNWSRRLEVVAISAGLAGSLWFVFSVSAMPAGLFAVAFIPFPFIVWATVRFGGPGAGLSVISTIGAAAAGTVAGSGPLVHESGMTFVQFFAYSGTAIPIYLLATANARRHRVERALEFRLELERLITSISTQFINLASDEIDSSIEKALSQIGSFAGVDRSYVFRYSDGQARLDNTHEWCASGITSEKDNLQGLSSDHFAWVNSRIRRQQVVYLPRVQDLPDEAAFEREEFERESIRSMLLVPMVIRSEVVGFVGFDSVRNEMRWSDDAITLLRVVGEAFANALEHKRAEEALLQSELLYQKAIEASEGIPYRLTYTDDSRQGFYEFAGNAIERLCGVPRSELTHARFGSMAEEVIVTDPQGVPDKYEYSKQFRQNEVQRYQAEVRMRLPDGTIKWISDFSVPVRDESSGKVIGSLGMLHDITERKSSEAELEKHRERLEELVETRTQSLLETNQQLEREISERKEVEHALHRSERLASIGTLAAGVAHEINNPLGSILLDAKIGLRQGEGHPDTRATFEHICEQTQRCARIVKNMLKFARDEHTDKWSNDLNQQAQWAVDFSKEFANKHGVTIDLKLCEAPAFVHSNPTEIEQVFVNLIRNGVQACDRGGIVKLHLSRMPTAIVATVSDNGQGMSQRDAERALDPFFTRRGDVGGTGLGLSVCHGIVTEHHGTLEIKTQEGVGSKLVVTFPVAAGETGKPALEVSATSRAAPTPEPEDTSIDAATSSDRS